MGVKVDDSRDIYYLVRKQTFCPKANCYTNRGLVFTIISSQTGDRWLSSCTLEITMHIIQKFNAKSTKGNQSQLEHLKSGKTRFDGIDQRSMSAS